MKALQQFQVQTINFRPGFTELNLSLREIFSPSLFICLSSGLFYGVKKVKIAASLKDFFLIEFNLRRKLSLSGGFNRQNSNLLPSFISRHTQELDLIYSRHQCSKGYKSSFESVSRAVSCQAFEKQFTCFPVQNSTHLLRRGSFFYSSKTEVHQANRKRSYLQVFP